MHRYTKVLLASLAATAILAMAVGSASANRLSVTSNRLWRVTWTSLRLNAAGNVILCPVTLEGSFHSATIVKTAELIGYIKEANVVGNGCTGGTATIRRETLPWHLRYRGYSGALPNITLLIVGLVGASFRVQPTGGVACNATTTATRPAVGNIAINPTTHVAESLTPDPNARIPLEGGLCVFGGEGIFEERSQSLVEVPGGNRITVTLI